MPGKFCGGCIPGLGIPVLDLPVLGSNDADQLALGKLLLADNAGSQRHVSATFWLPSLALLIAQKSPSNLLPVAALRTLIP